MQTLTISNQTLGVKEYNNQRVITLKDVDQVHGRPEGTARRNFNVNKQHLAEGVDYFVLNQPHEIRSLGLARPQGGVPESVTILTESGYLMLVKSFTDKLAWKVQRALVDTYFHAKAPDVEQLQLETPSAEVKAKTYKGCPVLTLHDLYTLTQVAPGTLSHRIRCNKGFFVEGTDYWMVTGTELVRFKRENQIPQSLAKCLTLITKSGLQKLSLSISRVPVDLAVLPSRKADEYVPPKAPIALPPYERNVYKEDTDAQHIIDETLKELGALERLVKRLCLYNTKQETRDILTAVALFQNTAFQHISALKVLGV